MNHSALRRLLVVALLSLFSKEGFCQFTPVSYNFNTTGLYGDASTVMWPDSVHDGNWGGAHDVTLSGLASDGFGNWTASVSATGTPYNFLLANRIASTSTSAAQAGVLSDNPFLFGSPSTSYPVKVAANLQGYVSYVYFQHDATEDHIKIETYQPSTTNLSVGTNVRFEGLPGGTGQEIEKEAGPPLHQQVFLNTGHRLSSSASEDPYERFDVAMDASYLYIVWEEDNAGSKSIWATVTYFDGTVYAAPFKISGSGSGILPTVAVNARAATSPNPRFDATWLTATVGGDVQWYQYYGGTGYTKTVTHNFTPPGGGSTLTWSNPQHARVLVASCASYGSGSMELQDRAIYIMADNNGMALFLNRIQSQSVSNPSNYCDGPLDLNGCGMIEARTAGNGFGLVNHYLVAFANPYDGNSASNAFNEYHCIYQVDRKGTDIAGPNKPLVIINGSSSSSRYCLTSNTTTHTFYYDPDVYFGAANQSGIHCYWRTNSKNQTYYLRDHRKIDEDIEENTLITDVVEVGDGRSHGGVLTPTLKSGLSLAVYSDPASSSYFSYPGMGTLAIDQSSTTDQIGLNIGDATNTGARLVAVGYGQVRFLSAAGSSTASTLTVNADNYIEWNGIPRDIGGARFRGGIGMEDGAAGSMSIVGSGATLSSSRATGGHYTSSISDPATVNIYPGANFHFDVPVTFHDALVNIKHGNSVFSATQESIGKSEYFTDVTATQSQFVMDGYIEGVNQFDGNVIMQLNGGYGINGGAGNMSFTDCLFRGPLNTGGTAVYGGGDVIFHTNGNDPALTISGGKSDGICFTDFSSVAVRPISITGVEFDHIMGRALSFNAGDASPLLYSINISNNYFYEFTPHSGWSAPRGIVVSNATDNSNLSRLSIENNTFDAVTGSAGAASVAAAIHLTNCGALVGYNTIGGAKFAKGIWCENSSTMVYSQMHSLLCSNSMTGLTSGSGLVTDYYDGYAKLNTSSGNDLGHEAGDNDWGHVIFSTYTNNTAGGFKGEANTTKVDMAGVHHLPPDEYLDVAAYNVISNNGYPQISLSNGAVVFLGNQDRSGPETWSVFGENHIERTASNPLLVGSSAVVDIGNIDKNYWGSATIDPSTVSPNGTNWDPANSSDVHSSNIDFTCSSSESAAPTAPTVYCSGGLTPGHKGSRGSLSVATENQDSVCRYLGRVAEAYDGPGSYQESYDTGRLFIERCYQRKIETGWVGPFGTVAGAASGLAYRTPSIWYDFREWLKKVLYYNRDTDYYCADVNELWTTYQNGTRTDQNDRCAILAYLIQNHRCPQMEDQFERSLTNLTYWRHKLWADSLTEAGVDTLTASYDSTLPSIDDIGLGLLRGPASGAVRTASEVPSDHGLLSVRAGSNPFRESLDLMLEMGREALVTVQVYDLLGEELPLSGIRLILEEPGTQRLHLPTGDLRSGTYYIRVSTDWGEVKTVKVVKE